ncbi:RusA family crossover junction endodeoxyribonuclease [uncultured Nocardioides sp.]|uniref:RusA family crossover junction endodeoxyribonuclease n=1 Tax=uncultured Nocardioides sp. TaxID=198441 RepID=UPI0026110277|nr:RusA family crossover junction endodeoxyribonuclease [uncultured Nocardioides sp.]
MDWPQFEQQVIASSHLPPDTRLELVWAAFERDYDTTLSRPPTAHERAAVSIWFHDHQARNDALSVVMADRTLRHLLHRTPSEKSLTLTPFTCRCCEEVETSPGVPLLSMQASINVEPWTAQSTRDRQTNKSAVAQGLAERNWHRPVADQQLCLTILSIVPRSRGHMDVDNLVKGLLDSLVGMLYADDYQVQCLTTRRLLTAGPSGSYRLSARVVHPYDADVIHEDGESIRNLFPRIDRGPHPS